jgi:serine/threonine protein kinase
MGEVYRAHDTKLDRDVALKILPVGALSDDTARARLVKEAQLAASLNHAAVCTIHDVGDSDGCVYVAMELIAAGCPTSFRKTDCRSTSSCAMRSKSPTRSRMRTIAVSCTAI